MKESQGEEPEQQLHRLARVRMKKALGRVFQWSTAAFILRSFRYFTRFNCSDVYLLQIEHRSDHISHTG
jgi:membrane-bound lytic murein transglycosylase B